ncbi:hypothetical protein DSO57_1004052 [Entomophthora muscae]|uniref:Uncharacterized protein n=1 Tax=Entomophthora muscae TaxID=34485 RepID=A0ACC2U6Y3_9FUNG|nr:hypothetical protein DSO57_1004052 [Entomophthora muscae]
MKTIPTAPPLPYAPPAQDYSKLGFIYITVLGLANQVVPHTGSWHPLATAVNYLVCIAPIVYMAFQAWPASPVGVQLDSGMGHDSPPLLQFVCCSAHLASAMSAGIEVLASGRMRAAIEGFILLMNDACVHVVSLCWVLDFAVYLFKFIGISCDSGLLRKIAELYCNVLE